MPLAKFTRPAPALAPQRLLLPLLAGALALFCFAGAARAGVFGAWAGTLVFTESGGRLEEWQCALEISWTETRLYVSDRNWCTYMHRELEIQNGMLLLAGRPIGTVTDDAIELVENRPEFLYQFSARVLPSGEIAVADVFHDWTSNHSEKVRGALRLGR